MHLLRTVQMLRGNWIQKSGKRSEQHIINGGALSIEVTKATGLGVNVVREGKKSKAGALEHASV